MSDPPRFRNRPFRFGVQANANADRTTWTELARRVEALGYSTLTMPDHLDGQLAPIPALMSAADATETLRVGALVFCNDYRHPVVLAKELATIDVLSEGRLEIGLGAGWMVTDYSRSGIPYDPAGARIDRLTESLSVFRGCLAATPFSFEGEHYTIDDYVGQPAPVQTPPPILIGGGGPRMLRIAAREADIVGVNPNLAGGEIDPSAIASMRAEAVDAKLDTLRSEAAKAGRTDEIELNIRAYMVFVTDDVAAALSTVADFAGTTDEAVEHSPFTLVGPPSKLIDDLRERRERWGFSYVVVSQNAAEAFAPIVAELAGT